MNKNNSKQVTMFLPNYLRFLCCIVGLLMLANPTHAEAKTTQTQKSTTSKSAKSSKPAQKKAKSKKTTSKSTKKVTEDTPNPVDSLFPEQNSPSPSESSEIEPDIEVTEDAAPAEESASEESAVAQESTPDDLVKNELRHDRGYRISVGPLLGVRTMTLQGDRNAYEHNAPFYMGGMIDAELRLHRFPSIDAELWLQADAGYGTTIGAFGHVDLANRSTALAFLSGQILMKRQFGDDWDMHFGLGMQALSLTVEPNLTYTGHRYIGPEIGLSARRWFDNHRLSLGTELYALPVLWTNKSSQSDDAQSFGFRAGAELGWSPGSATWAVQLRYRFQRFRTQFPLASEGSRGAISEDNQHLIMLMFSY